MSDRGWGRGAADKSSAGLKVEGANDVQRVESLAEIINLLAGKETRKALQNFTISVARNIDLQVLEERVRNSDGSGQPSEPAAAY